MGILRDFFLGTNTDSAIPETRADEPQHDPSTALTLPPRSAVTPVSAGAALGLVSVYRAVGIRVSALKQLSLDIWRADEKLTLPLWLRRPDVDTTWRQFIEQTTLSLDLHGNAYWRVRRNDDKSIRSLEVLNPLDVTIRISDSGRILGFTHRGADLPLDAIKHLSRLRVPGTPYGLGPIQAARTELQGAIDLRDYSANWFDSGDIPSGILSSDHPLTSETASNAKTAWAESQGGQHGVVVLGNGLKYVPVILSPADAQFLESRNFTTTEIARLFGVPASLMLAAVEGNSMTYANVSQEWLGFLRFGLTDDLLEIEDAISDLLPRTQTARFNIEALLRMDTATRYTGHESALRAGWMLPSEVRDIEGLPAIEGIDDRPAPTHAPGGAE